MSMRPVGDTGGTTLSHQSQIECQIIVMRCVVIALANNLNPEQKQMVDKAATFLADNFPWQSPDAAEYAKHEVRSYLGVR